MSCRGWGLGLDVGAGVHGLLFLEHAADDEQVDLVVQVDDRNRHWLHVIIEHHGLPVGLDGQCDQRGVGEVQLLAARGLGTEAPSLEADLGGVLNQPVGDVSANEVVGAEARAGGTGRHEGDVDALGELETPAERVRDGQDGVVLQGAQQTGVVQKGEEVAVVCGEEGCEVFELLHDSLAPCDASANSVAGTRSVP